MTLDAIERAARVAGLIVIAAAWFEAGRGMRAASARPPGRASALAARIGVLPAYLLVAIPYFTLCAVLWRPLPIEPSTAWRVAALAAGLPVGLSGAALYLWGRRTLGPMYNVTGTLGAQMYADHRLVEHGPYRWVRHPMYLGIALGAVGGLAMYRNWTFVFVVAALPGVALRARSEERLLAAEIGDRFEAYRAAVPAWIPAIRRRSGHLSLDRDAVAESTGPMASLRGMLAPNSGTIGRLVRGLLVAPAAGWVLFGTSWPLAIRVAAGVVLVLSLISAVSGHCFLYDLIGLVRRGRPQSRKAGPI